MLKILLHDDRSFWKSLMPNPFREVRSALLRGLLLNTQILQFARQSFFNLGDRAGVTVREHGLRVERLRPRKEKCVWA